MHKRFVDPSDSFLSERHSFRIEQSRNLNHFLTILQVFLHVLLSERNLRSSLTLAKKAAHEASSSYSLTRGGRGFNLKKTASANRVVRSLYGMQLDGTTTPCRSRLMNVRCKPSATSNGFTASMGTGRCGGTKEGIGWRGITRLDELSLWSSCSQLSPQTR